jgi:hypothetical protein
MIATTNDNERWLDLVQHSRRPPTVMSNYLQRTQPASNLVTTAPLSLSRIVVQVRVCTDRTYVQVRDYHGPLLRNHVVVVVLFHQSSLFLPMAQARFVLSLCFSSSHIDMNTTPHDAGDKIYFKNIRIARDCRHGRPSLAPPRRHACHPMAHDCCYAQEHSRHPSFFSSKGRPFRRLSRVTVTTHKRQQNRTSASHSANPNCHGVNEKIKG